MFQEETIVAETGFGLSAQEYYYWAEGLANLVPVPDLPRWTPNYSGAGTVLIPEAKGIPTATARDRTGAEVALGTATDVTPPITEIGFNTFTGQITDYRVDDRHYPSVIRSETMPDSLVLVDELGLDVHLEGFDFSQPDDIRAGWTFDGSSWQFTAPSNQFLSIGWNIPNRTIYTIRVIGTSLRGVDIINRGPGAPPDSENNVFHTQPAGDFDVEFTVNHAPSLTDGLSRFIIENRQFADNVITINSVSIKRSTDGILTNFPAQQPWVPLLGGSQAYLSGRVDGNFDRGVDTTAMQMSSFPNSSGIEGSWEGSLPAIGSTLTAGGVSVLVTGHDGLSMFTLFYSTSATPEQVQAAFQYPNTLTVTPP